MDEDALDPLEPIRQLIKAQQCRAALNAALEEMEWDEVELTQDVWGEFLRDARLLHHACAEAAREGDEAALRHWRDNLRDLRQTLIPQFGEPMVNKAEDIVVAALIAFAARSCRVEDVGQFAQRFAQFAQSVCSFVGFDGYAGALALARALLRQTEPTPTTSVPPEVLFVDDLFRLLPLRPFGDAQGRLRSGQASAFRPFDSAQGRLSPDRLAFLWDCARFFLGNPKRVMGKEVEIPVARVEGKQGFVDETLVLEVLAPGTGQTFLHPDDAFHTRPGDDFTTSMQRAFTAACQLAKRKGVDGRWRLLRGKGKHPAEVANGASASGQAGRGFYGTLTGKVPDDGVIALLQVTEGGRLEGLGEDGGVFAKTEAIARKGGFDTIVVASEADKAEAERALRECGKAGVIRVLNLASATLQKLVIVRSQAVDGALGYLRKMETELEKTPLLARFGRKLDDNLRIPLRVVPFEAERHKAEVAQTEHFHSPVSDEDDLFKKRYAPRGAFSDEEKRAHHPPQRLSEVEPRLQTAVLLGDPGIGKTEWLKHRARQTAGDGREKLENQTRALSEITFPAFLRLDDVAKELGRNEQEEKEQEESLRHFLGRTSCLSPLPERLNDAQRVATAMLRVLVDRWHLPERLAPFVWQKWLPAESGTRPQRAGTEAPPLLCLDAWDEVRSGQEILARCLNAFAKETPARIFLTSRIVGYNHRPLPVDSKAEGPNRELQIRPFEWDDTEQFVTSWFQATPEPERGAQMLGELHSKIAVWGMANNPLMATLLCVAYSPDLRADPLPFPLQRGAVYERVLWGLLGEWRKQREHPDQRELTDEEKKRIEAKLNLLAHIAHHFFQNGDERFSRTALETAVQNFLNMPDGEPLLSNEVMRLPDEKKDRLHLLRGKARQRQMCQEVTTALCHELIEDDGVLAKDSEDVKETFYGFLHLTFQEYLTACALAQQLTNSPTHQLTNLWKFVDKKTWLSEWQEVIILLAGKSADPEPLLTMLSTKEPTETNKWGDDLFRHRLALAALCLLEIPEESRNGQYAPLVNSITTATFSFWGKHALYRIATVPHFTRALPVLGRVNGKVIINGQDGLPLLDYIAALLASEHRRAQMVAVKAVKVMGSAAATDEILICLARMLAIEHEYVQVAAAEAVGSIGSAAATDAILTRLARMLASKDENVQIAAVKAVRSMGSAAATDEILDCLVQMFIGGYGWVSESSVAAAEAVRSMGSAAATDEILTRLARMLASKDEEVQMAAAKVVGSIGSAAATDAILTRLAQMLDSEYGCETAAEAVGSMGSAAATDEILTRLAQMFISEDWVMRLLAARTVEGMGGAAATPRFLFCLALMLTSEVWYVEQAAAGVVGIIRSAVGTDKILARLTHLAKMVTDADRYVVVAMAEKVRRWESMVSVVEAKMDIILTASASMLDSSNENARAEALMAVSAMGSKAATPVFLARLAQMLASKDKEVQIAAAEAVGSIGGAAATDAILTRLAQMLVGEDGSVQAAAMTAVRDIGGAAATDEILACLAQMLAYPSSRFYPSHILRFQVGITIQRMGSAAATPAVLARLAQMLVSKDDSAQRWAAMAAQSMGSAAATPVFLARLTRMLASKDKEVQIAAVKAAGSIGGAAATDAILTRLARMLASKDKEVQIAAAEAAGSIGGAAATDKILARLAQMLVSKDGSMRRAAAEATGQMMAQRLRIIVGLNGKWQGRKVEELSQ